MQLKDIRDKDQFEQFYKEHNLISTEEKNDYLRDCMGIIWYTGSDLTPEESLSVFEQHCLEAWNRIEYIQHG